MSVGRDNFTDMGMVFFAVEAVGLPTNTLGLRQDVRSRYVVFRDGFAWPKTTGNKGKAHACVPSHQLLDGSIVNDSVADGVAQKVVEQQVLVAVARHGHKAASVAVERDEDLPSAREG
jgi:hypothetical protein